MSNAIVIDRLRKTFGPKVAVDDVSFVVPTGSLVGFIGPNGAGKTTTIRMIMSILFPDSGGLEVLGKRSAVESKDRIGYLPEERGVYRKMRAGEFVIYAARLKGLSSADATRLSKEWIARVGLGEAYSKKCMELSKGMQQKIQFICAVIHQPDLIILDEPFSGLDPVNSRLLRDLIDEQHKAGRTIIFSTHQMYQAEQLCDRIVMIHQGVKRLDMTPAEIQRTFDPRTLIIEPFEVGQGEVGQAAMAEARGALSRVAGVASIEAVGRVLEVTITPERAPSTVLAACAEALPCRRAEVRRVSLEDIFVDIVQGTAATREQRQSFREALAAGATGADRSGD
jgi:ABC-2 type transport system ATP-binding protein